MDMKTAFFGTRQVAILLGIRPSALNQAVWDTRIPTPAKGPTGAYQWGPDDIARAAKAFHVLPSTIQQRIAATGAEEAGE